MLQPIILAAGKGTRMRSAHPKALYEFCGKSLLTHALKSYEGVPDAKPPLVVVGHGRDEVERAFGSSLSYVVQEELTGTASAVRACIPHLSPQDHVCISNVDQPFWSSDSIAKISERFQKERDALILGTTHVPDFEAWRAPFMHFGRVMYRQDGTVDRIVEYKNATEEERDQKDVNPGLYCVDVAWLTEALSRITANPLTGEYYLTDIIDLANADKKRIVTVALSPKEAIGINSPEDAEKAADALCA